MIRERVTVRGLMIASIVVLAAVLVFLGILFVRMYEEPGPFTRDPGGMRWERSIYGFGPAPEQQLRRPTSVAVGPRGHIHVTDPARSRVMVFSAFGELVRIVETQAGHGGEVPDSDEGLLVRPEAIDVDELGDLYVVDTAANKIMVFGPEGQFEREWRVEYPPRGICVTGGSVYVLGEGSVHVYNLVGAKIREFGVRGREPGQIDAYLGIDVHGGTIYIADSHNRRIQAFDTRGELLWARPDRAAPRAIESTSAEEPVEFAWDLPQDLVRDGAGRLVVADAFRFQLVALDPETGQVVGVFGDYGRDDGRFYYPTSIDYDPQRDWFVIADTYNDRVQVVRLPGSGGGPVTALRRTVDSPVRWLIPAMLVLSVVLVTALVQWRRTWVAQRAAMTGDPTTGDAQFGDGDGADDGFYDPESEAADSEASQTDVSDAREAGQDGADDE